MHDLKWLEENLDEAKAALQKRGAISGLDGLVEQIKKRRALIIKSEGLKQKRNDINDKLKQADKKEIENHRDEMRSLSKDIKSIDKELSSLEEDLYKSLLLLPNIPHKDVPDGKNEADNELIREVLDKPHYDFTPLDHVALGQRTNTIDLERAAKISGARFAFLKGLGAKLNRALMQFMTDFHIEQGDTELAPPFMVRKDALIGTGQFPKFKEDVFKVTNEDSTPYYLIPTAEVPLTNYFQNEILKDEELPKRLCAYSPCFRAEAGAAGRDTRGIIRLHQFEKVEMVRFCKVEDAKKELDLMVKRASKLLTLLELPHRIMNLCGGDLGFSAEKTYDLEVYLPSQGCYREISSCSSFSTFQARRAKIRVKEEGKKPHYLVTLNGSGLPLGRTLVAIYENHQQKDGSIQIPKVLWPYMNGQKVIK